MGTALGTLWAQGGHAVSFSYSRDATKLRRLASSAGKGARAASVAEAVSECEALLLAVRWAQLDDVIAASGGAAAFKDRVVISCSLPMTPDDTALAIGHTTSGAESVAGRLPSAHLVAAFNTIPSELLHAEVLRDVPERPAVVYCSDDARAKRVAATLATDAGLDPIDAGPLRVARYLEPFGLLVAQLAYDQGLGPELGYRLVTRVKTKSRRTTSRSR